MVFKGGPGLHGFFQGDILIRSALIQGLADLRANPELIDAAFSFLERDEMTKNVYGQKEADKAKKWFMDNNVPVVMTPGENGAGLPCISVQLGSSVAAETTLGDVHYDPQDFNQTKWAEISTVFNPVNYDLTTGIVTPPPDVFIGELSPGVGMYLFDTNGNKYRISEVFEDSSFRIDEAIVADFRRSIIKGYRPAEVTKWESAIYKQTYHVGVHVPSQSVYLLWLHTLVDFVLLRYKEWYLEARGFERSSTTSSDVMRREDLGSTQEVFSRFIDVTGYVRQYWPKKTSPTIQGMNILLQTQVYGHEVGTWEESINSGAIAYLQEAEQFYGSGSQVTPAPPTSSGPTIPPEEIEIFSYVHTQSSASSSWTVAHNLGYIPSVYLYTTGGVEFEGSVVHISSNVCIITLNAPLAGYARFV